MERHLNDDQLTSTTGIEYITQQVKLVRAYQTVNGLDDFSASSEWINNGHAERYRALYFSLEPEQRKYVFGHYIINYFINQKLK